MLPFAESDLRTRRGAPRSLPVELTNFIGRGGELSEIQRLLQTAHAITLTGPGGIGKTRLALRAASRLARHFPDGVWFVELAEIDNSALVPYALAHALRVPEGREDSIVDAVRAHIGERRVLLVLDNCEHVLPACRELVTELVSMCQRVRVLSTSRERLNVPGEALILLSPLEVAGDGVPDALTLLVDRAAASAPGFTLTDENADAASELCRRLDGLPLAIELAAVRLASMSAEDLRERLDDRLRLLAGAGGGLRATVDWSYALLSEEERRLWRRLSVFAGSFRLGAAEDVCAGTGLERARIVELIDDLVAKSILTLRRGGRRGRYQLLETLRLYGAERLAEAGEDVEFARRHAEWYAARVSGWWSSPRQRERLEELDLEWANVEAALDHFTAADDGVETGLRMAADLCLFWLLRGHYRAGTARLEALMALVPAPSETRARALWAVAFLTQGSADFSPPRAFAALEAAQQECEQTGGARERGYTFHGLALVHLRVGRVEAAEAYARQARELLLSVGDVGGVCLTLWLLAAATTARSSPDALGVLEEALDLSERTGNEIMLGLVSGLMGSFEWERGELAAAELRLKEAIRIQAALGHSWGLLTSLARLAWVAGTREQWERSALLLGAGKALSNELGIALFPHAQTQQDACEAATRTGMGDTRFNAAWERGLALRRDRVVAAALENIAPPPAATTPPAGDLSARELEVARLVAGGLSNPAIASELFLSVATVKTHVSHVLGKLGLQSRVQIAGWIADHEASAS